MRHCRECGATIGGLAGCEYDGDHSRDDEPGDGTWRAVPFTAPPDDVARSLG